MTPDEKLVDDVLHHTLNLFRLSASKQADIMRRLKAMEKRLIAELSVPLLSEANKTEIEAILKNTDEIISEHYDGIKDEINMPEIGRVVAKATGNSLTVALGSDAIGLPTQNYFKSLASNVLIQGSPAEAWWDAQSADTAFKFKAQVRQGLANSETNQQIITRIVGNKTTPGLMNIARRNAASLVQTAVQAVANDARKTTFEANSDVVKGMRQISTLDSHTSEICMAYSGAEWDLEGEPLNGSPEFNGGPPRHFNCRSVLVPITKTFKELGLDIPEPVSATVASDEGPIAATTTFDEFLTRKGVAYQNEMLGDGRAQMWRDGKITLRDLVDGKGRPLTLADLQERFGKEFSGAFFMKERDSSINVSDILSKFPNANSEINKIKEKLALLPETKNTYFKDGEYQAARAALHDKILFEGVNGYDPETGKAKFYPAIFNSEKMLNATPDGYAPTFTILGGRGGSGKSSFNGEKFAEAKVYDANKVLLLDSDAIKAMLPEYKGFNAFQVHEESSDILKKAVDYARDARVNVVVDGTLNSQKTVMDRLVEFKDAGYRTELHYMYLGREEAATRAVQRSLGKTGRYVPPEVILGNTNNEKSFDALAKLVDNWSFRDNNVTKGQAPKLVAEKGNVK